jgi:hypothetical protein
MPFQSTLNIQPAPAIAGDFASANVYGSILSGSGKFVAGVAGLTEGLFCWHDASDDTKLNNYGSGAPAGFLHREMRQQMTTFLAETGGLIQPGFEVSAMRSGDFWIKNETGGAVTRGQKIYAETTTGRFIAAAAAGQTIAGASFTGVIAAGVLTASAVTGTIKPYSALAGTGVTAGSTLGAQLTGTPGGAGTYAVVGTTTASSAAMTTAGAVETAWYVQSAGANGEVVKMSRTIEG